jgi:hypothetical protein
MLRLMPEKAKAPDNGRRARIRENDFILIVLVEK